MAARAITSWCELRQITSTLGSITPLRSQVESQKESHANMLQ